VELSAHKKFSESKIEEMKKMVERIPELKNNGLCIFSTGSYGRLEASEHSDIDLFFLDTNKNKPTSNVDLILINSEIIKICRKLKFPEFSKDGLYLKTHCLKGIKENLGSPADDYNNFYTARMLLLLESKPLYNQVLFEKCIDEIIDSYYVDFHNHTDNFKPIFLTNDIIRFWKTLCLNYEHKRISKNSEDGVKNVTHSKNLKLKFSRKLICFSFILKLISCKEDLSKEQIKKIALMTPIERLESIKGEQDNKISLEIDKIISDYQWFIDKTQIKSKEMLLWISDQDNRSNAFKKSDEFGQNIYNVLTKIDKNQLVPKILI
jgi:predicted nucleotidyltransferase